MKSTIKRFTVAMALIALLIVGLVGVSACAPKAAEVNGPIRIGHLADMTGLSAPCGKSFAEAVEDYVRFRNETQGGIAGHPIELTITDGHYTKDVEISILKSFIASQTSCVVIEPTGITPTAKVLLSEAQIPCFITPELTALLPAQGNYIFTATPSYIHSFDANVKYWANSWTESRPMRVGCLLIDTAAGHSIAKGLEDTCAELPNAELVSVNFVGNVVDVTSQVLALKEAKVDRVVTMHGAPVEIAYIKTAAAQGMPISKVPCCMHAMLTVPAFTQACLDAGGAGMETQFPFALWEENVQGNTDIKKAKDMFHEGDEGSAGSWCYDMGWTYTDILCKGIEEIVNKVGYDKLTGSSIKDLLESGAKFETGGLLGSVSFSPDSHFGCNRSRILQLQADGSFKLLSDWVYPEPWAGERLTLEYWTK
jgi:branched-chain amino acid transport system substrate-binding protein